MLSCILRHPGNVLNVVQLSNLKRKQIKHEDFSLKKCNIVV